MKSHQKFMSSEEADYFSEEISRQFEEMPLAIKRISLSKDKLVQILLKVPIWESEDRMQFKVPENQKEYGLESGSQSIFPQRIITTYDTNYSPTGPVRAYRNAREILYDSGKILWDPEVICRKLRADPGISKIRKRALDEGDKIGLFCRLNCDLDIKEEFDGGYVPGGVFLPLIFIPGTTKEEQDTLARFCIKHQHPSQDKISYVKHGVFEDRLYS